MLVCQESACVLTEQGSKRRSKRHSKRHSSKAGMGQWLCIVAQVLYKDTGAYAHFSFCDVNLSTYPVTLGTHPGTPQPVHKKRI